MSSELVERRYCDNCNFEIPSGGGFHYTVKSSYLDEGTNSRHSGSFGVDLCHKCTREACQKIYPDLPKI